MKIYTKEYSGTCNSLKEAFDFLCKCLDDFNNYIDKKESKNKIDFDNLPIPEKVKM